MTVWYLIPGVSAAMVLWLGVVLSGWALRTILRHRSRRVYGRRLPRDIFLTIGVVAWAIYTWCTVVVASMEVTWAYPVFSLGFLVTWLAAGWACYRRDGGWPEWMKYRGLRSDE